MLLRMVHVSLSLGINVQPLYGVCSTQVVVPLV